MLLSLDTPDIEGSAVAAQGGQSAASVAVLQFIAQGAPAQGSQAITSSAVLELIAQGISAQGTQSIAELAAELFGADIVTAQASQTSDGAALLAFIAAGVAGQGRQTAAGSDAAVPAAQGASGGYAPRVYGQKIRRAADGTFLQPISGSGEAEQGGASSRGRGFVRRIVLEGEATSEQPSAEVIAIGAVDNRRARRLRMQKLAAAALLAA